MANKIYFKMDGYPIEEDIIEEFDLKNHPRNLRYSQSIKSYVLDFVGFVLKDEKMLVVFPKNYTSVEQLTSLNEEDINLLFNVLIKSYLKEKQVYIGEIEGYESTYPFKDFFVIYRYYLNYGLYKEVNEIIKPGNSGKISWKNTIRKAQVIRANDSMIFTPLYVKKNYSDQVFLTECMAYVINHTTKRFSGILNLKQITNISVQTELFGNTDVVIAKLREIKSKTFKDKDKKLISAFLEFFKAHNEGGNMLIKRYKFELVWQKMVEKYLNSYFIGLENGLPVFDYNSLNQKTYFKEKSYKVNKLNLNENHQIRPDHYFKDKTDQYIFDSKYYVNLNKLDYKQIAYHSLLKKQVGGKTYSALIAPTFEESYSEEYFELAKRYYELEEDKMSIAAVYLNVKKVMKCFNND